MLLFVRSIDCHYACKATNSWWLCTHFFFRFRPMPSVCFDILFLFGMGEEFPRNWDSVMLLCNVFEFNAQTQWLWLANPCRLNTKVNAFEMYLMERDQRAGFWLLSNAVGIQFLSFGIFRIKSLRIKGVCSELVMFAPCKNVIFRRGVIYHVPSWFMLNDLSMCGCDYWLGSTNRHHVLPPCKLEWCFVALYLSTSFLVRAERDKSRPYNWMNWTDWQVENACQCQSDNCVI